MRATWESLGAGIVVACLAATHFLGPAYAQPPDAPDLVQLEEYPIYDRVVQSKFLTSETTLLKINRVTVTRLGEEEKPLDRGFFTENDYFNGLLQPAVLTDFLTKLRRPARLEPRFHFGVRYRLVSDQETDDSEVSLAPIAVAARLIQYDASVIQLEFSRVAFNVWKDQAMVYVGNYRTDGSGAGFLVLLSRREASWEVLETEVIWTAQAPRRR
ncbi:MAG TPA: hypothetical protein VJ692_00545 [Nitrospiraceae bacterium]|nr:hypothetical protein [Nitrospiraceae bacterium]